VDLVHAGTPGMPTPSPAVSLTRPERLLGVALLGVLLVLSIASERSVHVTVDERNHLRYGQGILRLDSDRFDDSKMPVSAFNALPAAVASWLPQGALRAHLESLHAARYPTMIFSLVVAVCVFAWARRLYGAEGGLLALALYVFDPNLLAHGQLATTDLYAAGATLLAVYSFWRFLSEGGTWRAVVAAIALGFAQVAKYSLVLLFPVLAIVALVYHARALRESTRQNAWAAVRRGLVGSVAFVAISLVVINAAFLFNGTFTPLDDYNLDSDAFVAIRSALGPASRLPLPFPVPYLQGLDMVIDHERSGASFGRLYLLGELREGGSLFPGYYLYAGLYKTPLATLVLLGATALALVRRRTGSSPADEACLLIPLVLLSVYFNLFNRSQIGIRYILVVYPLAYVLCGSLLTRAFAGSRRRYAAITVALAALVLSVGSYYPYYIPYFNELVGRRINGYRLLADSNLDWGQYGYELERYRADHPDAVMEPAAPTAGTVLVRVNYLVGVTGQRDDYAWLRDHFRPVDHIGYGVLVYRIEPGELDALGLRR
jgi:4-amino-4-deoxy-L-arabinose transferase-like glycosyltransferase